MVHIFFVSGSLQHQPAILSLGTQLIHCVWPSWLLKGRLHLDRIIRFLSLQSNFSLHTWAGGDRHKQPSASSTMHAWVSHCCCVVPAVLCFCHFPASPYQSGHTMTSEDHQQSKLKRCALDFATASLSVQLQKFIVHLSVWYRLPQQLRQQQQMGLRVMFPSMPAPPCSSCLSVCSHSVLQNHAACIPMPSPAAPREKPWD